MRQSLSQWVRCVWSAIRDYGWKREFIPKVWDFWASAFRIPSLSCNGDIYDAIWPCSESFRNLPYKILASSVFVRIFDSSSLSLVVSYSFSLPHSVIYALRMRQSSPAWVSPIFCNPGTPLITINNVDAFGFLVWFASHSELLAQTALKITRVCEIPTEL